MLVVIVADNGIAAQVIRRSFRHMSGIRVAGYVDGRRPCGTALADVQPDVAIVDIPTHSSSMPARVREIRSAVPSTKVIALGAEAGGEWASEAVRAGAHATIAKTVQPSVLALLVREIWAGTIHHGLENDRASAADDEHASLTTRELEILRLVARGASNGRIAATLWVTEQTVKFHLSNVYRKLGVRNRTEASHYAHTQGILAAEPRSLAA
jgi:DNA-binding NarL/FixJ family response regulator